MQIETTILGNLLQNEEYTRKVLPFLKEDYFTENADKTLYGTVNEFVNKHKKDMFEKEQEKQEKQLLQEDKNVKDK